MANLRKFLGTLVSGSKEHRWKGITPQCVALIFDRSPEEGEQSHLGPRALVCNSYPIAPDDAKECGERFCQPTWRYLGCIFAYRNPEGGTQFEAHPDPEVSDEKWIQMMKAPVFGTGLTYQEKISCRLTGLSYEEYLAAKNREDAISSEEPGPCGAQVSEARVPGLHQIAGLRSTRQMAEATREMFDDLPKHRCGAPGKPWLAVAPLDPAIMDAMVTIDTSTGEANAQLKTLIAAAAAKNPNPTEPVGERIQAFMLADIPFVMYCGLCLAPICVIYPEQMKEQPRP